MHHDPARAVHLAVRRMARAADRPLVLAVSGGLDSMTLLSAVATVARNQIAAVATFDHGTGLAASRAAQLVARVGAALGIDVVVGRIREHLVLTEGREAAWRTERHQFLRQVAERTGAAIVTAHTEDDQLETVLMRVIRGSGARGLAGLYAEGAALRPFVRVRREVLESYAQSQDVHWVDDPSNSTPEFFRNRVRRDLLPALRRADPSIDGSLLGIARRAQTLRQDVERFISERLRVEARGVECLMVGSAELADHDRDSLAVLWSALAGRIGVALDRRGTRRIAEFTIEHPRSGSIPLAGGWCLEATRSTYILKRHATASLPAMLPLSGSVEWGKFRFRVAGAADSDTVWSAAIEVSRGSGVVRAWNAGDRLEPAAGQQRRRVTRYLSDARLTGQERKGWPVVVAGDDVVWIPGVRRSDAATDRSGRPVRHYVCERIDR